MSMLLHGGTRVVDGLGLEADAIYLLLLIRRLGFNTRNLLGEVLPVCLDIPINSIDVLPQLLDLNRCRVLQGQLIRLNFS